RGPPHHQPPVHRGWLRLVGTGRGRAGHVPRHFLMGMSPYVARLRALVGHGLLLLPSATVLPWDADGRVLLVRQADSGLWGTVGGAIEPDESPEDAACREA